MWNLNKIIPVIILGIIINIITHKILNAQNASSSTSNPAR